MAGCIQKVRLFLLLAYCTATNGIVCNEGFYGLKCENPCGHCIGGPIFCDPGSGHCANGCAWGYTGSTCKENCPHGTYGYACQELCSKNCKHPVCNVTQGDCSSDGCKPGFSGKHCTKFCPRNSYGVDCGLRCDCLCGCEPFNGTCKSHDHCEKEEVRAKRWKRQAEDASKQSGSGPAASKEGSAGTQMKCSKMKQEFEDLKAKLNNKVDIPLWPLFVLLTLTVSIMTVIGVWDLLQQQKRETYMANWEREYLDKPLEEAALSAKWQDEADETGL